MTDASTVPALPQSTKAGRRTSHRDHGSVIRSLVVVYVVGTGTMMLFSTTFFQMAMAFTQPSSYLVFRPYFTGPLSSAFAPPSSNTNTKTESRQYQSSVTVDDMTTTLTGIPSSKSSTSPLLKQRREIMDRSLVSNHPKYTQQIPKLGTIMKMLPKESFSVSAKESLLYFGLDLVAVLTCLSSLHAVVTSDFYHALPVWQQALTVGPLQVLSGFAMWCMWCIGHDAGHTTVSKTYPWVNRLVGEIAHSVICLTPFVPWAKSHLKHHLNHNHIDRDYSHQWFVREEKDDLHPVFLAAYQLRTLQLPFLYLVYLLLGIPDGGHVIFYGRMWQREPLKEKINATWSVAVSVATAGTLWYNLGTADFVVVCMVPWLVTSFWLFMVTYLQHHSDDGVLYTDDTWDFTRGAFETVDRSYGGSSTSDRKGIHMFLDIDRLSHHMMDGHVAHHLFFTKIPHYRLRGATEALKAGLEEEGYSHLYKNVDTPDFTQEIVKQFHHNWFFVNEDQVVRENQQKVKKLEYQKKFQSTTANTHHKRNRC